MEFSMMFADAGAASPDAGGASPSGSRHVAHTPNWELRDDDDEEISLLTIGDLASYGIVVESPGGASATSSAAASPVAARSGLYQGGPWHVEQACSIRRVEPRHGAQRYSPALDECSGLLDIADESDEDMPDAEASSSPAASRSAIPARGPRREASDESSTSSADYSAFLLFHRLSLEALDVSASSESRDVSHTEFNSDLSYVSTVPTSAGGSDDEAEDKADVALRRNTILPSIKIVASSPWPASAASSNCPTPQMVPACSEPADAEEECDVCERPASRCRNYACLLQGLEMLQSDVFAREASESPSPASPVEEETAATPPATAPSRSSSEACVSAMLGGRAVCTHGLPAGRDCGDPTCEGCGAIFFNATPGGDASSSGKAVLDFLATASAPVSPTAPAAPRASRKRSSASDGTELLGASTPDKPAKADSEAALAARREEWMSRMRGQTRFYGNEKRKESRRSAAPSLLRSGPTGGVTLKHGDAVVIAAPRTLAAARGPVLRNVQPTAPRAPLPQLHPVSFLPGATMSDLVASDAVQPTPKSASLLYETKVYHRACQTPCPAPPLARFALHQTEQRTTPTEADKAALARKKKPTPVLRLLR